MGWTNSTWCIEFTTASDYRGAASGCFSMSTSKTVFSVESESYWWRDSKQELDCSESIRSADVILPRFISSANLLPGSLVPGLPFVLDELDRCRWIVRASFKRSSIFPSCQAWRRRLRHFEYSWAFDFPCGFCRRICGMIMAAKMATISRAEASAYAWKSLASSVTNCLPDAPEGT